MSDNESNIDIIGIFDKDFNQLFPIARPIRASIFEMARMFDHPVEKSAPVVDHRIILPVEIDMIVKLVDEDYQSVYLEIKNAFRLGSVFTIRTRSDSYQNMVLGGFPHEEVPDDGDSLTLILKFKELLVFGFAYRQFAPRHASDATTVKTGEQAGKPSVLIQGVNAAKSIGRAVKNWAGQQ